MEIIKEMDELEKIYAVNQLGIRSRKLESEINRMIDEFKDGVGCLVFVRTENEKVRIVLCIDVDRPM